MPIAVVRAKLAVTAVKHTQHQGAEVTLTPQYDPDIPEDMRFMKATPWGEFSMKIDNPDALQALMPGGELGKQFYLDFIPVGA